MELFIGIDPGNQGALAVLDSQGAYVHASRWNPKNPLLVFNTLERMMGEGIVKLVYLEGVSGFQQHSKARIINMQPLLINVGVWIGFLTVLKLPFTLIKPITWQAHHKLLAKHHAHLWPGKTVPSALDLARAKFPNAPLEYLADNGKADALLLASLALSDHSAGLNRQDLQDQAKAKAKTLKARKRALNRSPQPPKTPAWEF